MPDQESEHYANQLNLMDLITFAEAARLSGFTDRYLRKLAGENKLWAIKLGRNWFTTAQAINEYLAQGRKPGPKSKKPIE